jgi:tetratricopeptide (TPR) repeat protein
MRCLAIALALCILSTVCNSQSSPNMPPQLPTAPLPASANTLPAQPPLPQTQLPSTATVPPQPQATSSMAPTERDAYKQALEAYKNSLDTIKWAIGIIGTLVLALIGYALFKDKKEYENALKGAEKACEKAEQWEEKARTTCDEIDTLVKDKLVEIEKASELKAQAVLDAIDKKVETKLKEIEAKAQKSTRQIDAKAMEQIHIAKLSSEAFMLYNEGKYEEACDKCAQIVKLKPDNYLAYNTWGVALTKLARIKEDEKLFEEACRKFEQVIKIKPDEGGLYNTNWGCTLIEWARLKDNEKLMEEACRKFEQAIKNNPDNHTAYIYWGTALALWANVKGNEDYFKEAGQKYEQAIKIKPDEPRAYFHWGGILLLWAKLKIGTPEHEHILKEAEEKYLKAENLKKGTGAYGFAHICSLRGDKGGCRKWLELGQETNNLPIRRYAMKDSYLASVCDEDWFKKLKWEDEE